MAAVTSSRHVTRGGSATEMADVEDCVTQDSDEEVAGVEDVGGSSPVACFGDACICEGRGCSGCCCTCPLVGGFGIVSLINCGMKRFSLSTVISYKSGIAAKIAVLSITSSIFFNDSGTASFKFPQLSTRKYCSI